MRRRITLLVTALMFACSFVSAADNEDKQANEKTWSIGIGKKGLEVQEIEYPASTVDNAQSATAQQSRVLTEAYRPLGTDPRWSKAAPICLGGDIDVAYIRIKKEFGYLTPDERLAATPGAWGNIQVIKRREGFEYVAQQGVYYLMRDRSRRTGDRIIETKLSKDGTNKYCLEYGFANVGLTNVPAYAAELKARYIAAIQ